MINLWSIERWYRDSCTLGILTVGEFKCFTLELPWEKNEENVSCIPGGTYRFFKRNSPTNGRVIELRDVENRTYVQVHSGNYTRQIRGCVLVGESIKFLDGDGIPDVTNSKNTLKRLLKMTDTEGEIILG